MSSEDDEDCSIFTSKEDSKEDELLESLEQVTMIVMNDDDGGDTESIRFDSKADSKIEGISDYLRAL